MVKQPHLQAERRPLKRKDKKLTEPIVLCFFSAGYAAHWFTHPGLLHPRRGRSHRLRVLETHPPPWTNHIALLQLVPLTYWPCLLPTPVRGPRGRPAMPLSRLRTWTCGPSAWSCHKPPVFRAENNKSWWEFMRQKSSAESFVNMGRCRSNCDSPGHVYTC